MAPQIEAVSTKSAPAPLPQSSQAVKHNGMVYCSGNVGVIPGTNFELIEGTVKDRAVGFRGSQSVQCVMADHMTSATSYQESRGYPQIVRQ
jgi:enamine deaminase RidA (YjgF/YER057c/UK114 family)